MSEQDIFWTPKYTSRKNRNTASNNIEKEGSEVLDQPTFLALSTETELTMESAMKYLNLFGERLEKAKTLLSNGYSIQTNNLNQKIDTSINNVQLGNHLIQEMSKIRDDIRSLKEHIILLKGNRNSVQCLKQASQIKTNVINVPLDEIKDFKMQKLSNENFVALEKYLVTRFPILSSGMSISQTETPDSKILPRTNLDTCDSIVVKTDHLKTNKASFVNEKILNTNFTLESLSEFYHPLSFEAFLKNDIDLSLDTNNIGYMNAFFSCIELELVGRLFEAMKRLSIDSLSNENAHDIDKRHSNKMKIEAALKILEGN